MQLCAALKSRADLSHIPVILMTASVQRLQVAEGYRHGATGYLMKPFSMAELRTKIEEYVSPPSTNSIKADCSEQFCVMLPHEVS